MRREFPGALYHLASRGDRREAVFENDADRAELLDAFAHGLARHGAAWFACCPMRNHDHFMVQTHQPNLSRSMRHVDGDYTHAYKRRQERWVMRPKAVAAQLPWRFDAEFGQAVASAENRVRRSLGEAW